MVYLANSDSNYIKNEYNDFVFFCQTVETITLHSSTKKIQKIVILIFEKIIIVMSK